MHIKKPNLKIKLTVPQIRLTKKRVIISIITALVIIGLVVGGILVYHAHHHTTSKTSPTSTATSSSSTSSTGAESIACKTSTAQACSPPTIPAGFPNASDTGVPANATLASYSGPITLSVPNKVISGVVINGCVNITAQHVTLSDSRIICKKMKAEVLNIANGGSATLSNDELDGDNDADVGLSGSNITANALSIDSSHDGIHLGSNDTISNSYVHDLSKVDGLHSDTVQVVKGNSATDDTFNHDSFVAALPGDIRLNSAFHVGANLNHTFIVENSYLDGGSFTMQYSSALPANRDIEIINNAFGRNCQDGILDGGNTITVTGNYWADNHQPATEKNSMHGACYARPS